MSSTITTTFTPATWINTTYPTTTYYAHRAQTQTQTQQAQPNNETNLASGDEVGGKEEKKKICSACGKPKSLNQFHKDNKSKDKKSAQCKDCRNKRDRLNYTSKKEARAKFLSTIATYFLPSSSNNSGGGSSSSATQAVPPSVASSIQEFTPDFIPLLPKGIEKIEGLTPLTSGRFRIESADRHGGDIIIPALCSNYAICKSDPRIVPFATCYEQKIGGRRQMRLLCQPCSDKELEEGGG
jgi:hypothetical protein